MFKLSPKYYFKFLLLITCTLTFLSFTAQARTPLTQGLKNGMAMMKAESEKLGEPKLDGENLYFGKTKINGDFTIVDAVKSKYGGTATFFIKKSDTYVRVSTNVMKEGNRAVGTILDPQGPAIVEIRQGKAYFGIADVLGNIFDTGYDPIRNSNNEIIGIYYVGQPLFSGKLTTPTK
jgi:hypothetical protein